MAQDINFLDLHDSFKNINENHNQEKIGYLLEKTEDFFRKNHEFQEEFYDFVSLKLMADYLLKKNMLDECFSLIETLFYDFLELILFNNELSLNDYEKQSDEFVFKSFDYKNEFYADIYEKSDSYDEENLGFINNILFHD
ncbi:MAG: hypothetical protein Q4P18_08390 [Methanobrevibacter sp.]|uniref:hypothetical protein n=1 Tax=Methanobrevibacter sp. TaxID=66852 RepID=UPI0026E0A0BE|nr:hypothetical protein [Methanobrevibacter sp.]MDO5849541.1 hypothetical protein [Methanobrevibacter sp.]